MILDFEPKVIVLAEDGIWSRRCVETLTSSGLVAARRRFSEDSVRGEFAKRQVFVCSIPNPRSPRALISLVIKDYGGRIVQYFGKDLDDFTRMQERRKGNLALLKSEDPGFEKLMEWIHDPLAQALHLAKVSEDRLKGRYVQHLHDPARDDY